MKKIQVIHLPEILLPVLAYGPSPQHEGLCLYVVPFLASSERLWDISHFLHPSFIVLTLIPSFEDTSEKNRNIAPFTSHSNTFICMCSL
jgi:hypothetical protein